MRIAAPVAGGSGRSPSTSQRIAMPARVIGHTRKGTPMYAIAGAQTTVADVVASLGEERKALYDEFTELAKVVQGEEKRAFTADEQSRWDAIKAELEDIDARVAQLVEAEERAERAAEVVRRATGGTRTVSVTSEPRTYSPDSERQGVSFFRDVASRGSDPGAQDRLTRHMREAEDFELRGIEKRDVGMGAFAGLTVPQYLTDLVAPLRRAGRPLADIANKHPLPAQGMTVNISRITTGSAVAAQATENTGVQETDMDDTLLTVNVRTIAGMQDVSRQAIDRSEGVDEIVVADLTRAYHTELNRQIINTDGTSGTHLGIRSTAGIVAVAYTDATPTAGEMWPKLWDLVQQIQSGVFLGVSHFVAHPRRFWWLVSQVGTSFPFIAVYEGPTDQAGSVEGTGTYEQGPVGRLGPVPVILDGTIPTNLGGGTNEDVFLGVTASELHLWEEANAPLFIRTEEALSNQLSVRFVGYGYSAFTAGRYPGAHGTISGTGLVTPTF